MEPLRLPRLVIGGASSGAGKTTVAVAMERAFRARGLKVAAFKIGPDYLDPTYHARAVGGVCHNLDAWMMGREGVLRTIATASRGADVAVIEGVMGLYDGVAPTSNEGSTAEMAKWLQAPVLAVVDASGMARTIAAIAQGLAGFDKEVRLAGVFANRVGSKGHLELLQKASRGGIPVFGALPSQPELAFPERHLGLLAASADASSEARLDAWGAVFADWCNVDGLLDLARSAPELTLPPEAVTTSVKAKCRIAVARDAAFHFYYEDNLRRLESLGAELIPFSPISDSVLPEADGLLIGGGYPEAHADDLTKNEALRSAVKSFAERGGPIYAECGGLMFLSRAIRTLDGREHAMVGLLPGVAAMTDRLQEIGYVEVETARDTILGRAGIIFRGHQFRHSTLEGAPTEDLAYRLRRKTGRMGVEGYQYRNVVGSYVHAHWASNPLVAEGFVASCRRFREAP
jgi:cobyrinic acid a,c-diamide synthase